MSVSVSRVAGGIDWSGGRVKCCVCVCAVGVYLKVETAQQSVGVPIYLGPTIDSDCCVLRPRVWVTDRHTALNKCVRCTLCTELPLNLEILQTFGCLVSSHLSAFGCAVYTGV